MKSPLLNKSIAVIICVFFCSLSLTALAQAKHPATGTVKIVIEGTSNIHDWNMKSDKGSFSGVFDVNTAGLPTGLSALNFSVPAQSLKSEHSGMDKNTYKALNVTKFPAISFTSGSAVIKQESASGVTLITKGQLTISGTTKEVLLTASGVVNPDKTVTYSGQYQLKMTDYKVDPPSIMFGTIKTGNDIVVKYTLVLKTI
jgi:polyisoprenoid-binding protein YceI